MKTGPRGTNNAGAIDKCFQAITFVSVRYAAQKMKFEASECSFPVDVDRETGIVKSNWSA